jgi:hypothetical protein
MRADEIRNRRLHDCFVLGGILVALPADKPFSWDEGVCYRTKTTSIAGWTFRTERTNAIDVNCGDPG